MSRGPDAFEGGCHCGRLRFRMTQEPIFVNGCHCVDCQRLTGSAFAVNAMIEADHVVPLGEAWAPADLSGDGDGSRAWRCSACGVLLYAEHPFFGNTMRFVRVGTLDEGRRFAPDAHFFVRSKHPWVEIPPGVPRHEALPPDDAVAAPLPADRQARLDAAVAKARKAGAVSVSAPRP